MTSRAKRTAQTAELAYVNQHYGTALAAQAPASSGAFSRLRNFVRAKIAHVVRASLLDSYVSDQQNFNANVVRVLNQLSESIDSGNFQVDDSVLAELNRIERATGDRLATTAREFNQRLGNLAAANASQQAELRTLESVARGLERIVGSLSRGVATDQLSADAHSVASEPTPSIGTGANQGIDYTYLMLENRYRGAEPEVSQRLSDYPEIFRDVPGPVLEIGAGRGELQTLFRNAKLPSYGIELDRAMVERCREQGLDVRNEDGIAHLLGLEDASLGGVIAIQVVEHLPLSMLKSLFEGCRRTVAVGGKIVFETINTESMVALCRNYFRDPTHAWPMHPQTMKFLLEMAGLSVIAIEKRSPYPAAATLQEIAPQDFMTPRWIHVLDSLNHNFKVLNELLYDHQDYRIIAEVR